MTAISLGIRWGLDGGLAVIAVILGRDGSAAPHYRAPEHEGEEDDDRVELEPGAEDLDEGGGAILLYQFLCL